MHLFMKLFELKNEIEKFYEFELNQFELSAAQYFLMAYIGESNQITPTQLSVEFGVSKPAISRRCRELEFRGLIERHRVDSIEADYRLVYIKLTDAGKQKITAVNEALEELVATRNEFDMVGNLDASKELISTLVK